MLRLNACVLLSLAFVACHSKQTVFRSTACFRDSPGLCGTYEGKCYGQYSHSAPARSPAEAEEFAAERACTTRYGGGIMPGSCSLGPSYDAATRKATLAGFTFASSSFEKVCP